MMELIVRSVPCGECRKRGKKMAEIYLAGGCFWGLEEYFSRIPGVEQTTVGSANGQVETTNYQLIKETDHAGPFKSSIQIKSPLTGDSALLFPGD